MESPAEIGAAKAGASDPGAVKNGASDYPLTDLYASMLEENILLDPGLWLWTHKRWKIPVSYPDATAAGAQ